VGSREQVRQAVAMSVSERVAALSHHVRSLIADRRLAQKTPDDAYLGLYVGDDEADRIAGQNGEALERSRYPRFSTQSNTSELDSTDSPSRILDDLARAFNLEAEDLDLLIIACAPDLEPRFERLYGYLHDDLTRRRASVGLALELTGHGFGDERARQRLSLDGALVRGGLVVVEEPLRPFLTRPLRVPDRILAHLLGSTVENPELARYRSPAVLVDQELVSRELHLLAGGVTPLHLRDGVAGIGAALAATALSAGGLEPLCIDLGFLEPGDDPVVVVRSALREARLTLSGLVITIPDEVAEENPEAMRVLGDCQWPTFVITDRPWNPDWSRNPVMSDVAPHASSDLIARIWASAIPELDATDLYSGVRQFRLRPDQIVRSAQLAKRRAAGMQRHLALNDAFDAARAQNSSKLERLAKRTTPAVAWEDLVVPADVRASLEEIDSRYRCRDLVHGDWGMGGTNNRRLGVVALFAGPSGVGKTMAAEALAASLQLDLYQVNLATVVDKYIGETEKNLERIFSAAEGVNGVIFFDEADALFGKRSEVSDAKDRYANVEVAYLLQRLESFGGVAILATNLRTNVDDAFTRRLDALVDFPEPDASLRLVLWDRCLGSTVPRDADIDLDFLAERFRLSGGNIRNITVAAAFLAAGKASSVTMHDLVISTAREYRKLGRLCTAAEFGPWAALAVAR
jgi:hypothetical protein